MKESMSTATPAKKAWQPPAAGSKLARLLPVARRLARLAWVKLRHPRARLGRKIDVRARFCLRQAPGANVRIGAGCVLDNDLTIECRGSLEIGRGTIFGHHCTVAALDSVTIGEDCLIAEMVSIRDHNHRFERLDVPYRDQGMEVAPVRIGRNVWLAAKVTVAAGVTIGDNTVVGANAVVTRDLPANAVAAGVPARGLRLRSPASPPTDDPHA